MNVGLLIIRITAGVLFAAHGLQKVSFRLGGQGLAGGIAEFRADGFRGGALTAWDAAGGQLTAGALFLAGVLTPVAAATGVGVMTVAVTVKWANGPWAPHDGYEYPGILVVVAAVLGFTGPGRWSVDGAYGLTPWPGWVAAAAAAPGLTAGLLTRLALRRAPRVPAAEDAR
ncbi:DoxX family protein [Actinacidiphila guanduensis]|uniref:Putative oxidoreductase n=1 Tax=Actinacidiphila guanduensis TaxID=310781 RepID=A0A1G9VU47_9ACTN|nr:DoxX family protein [Actinacidiphila guanduensis]SDM75395.1 putative oxidoreductase [Actinacidiphila guanduensis]